MVRKTQYCQDVSSTKTDLRFNAISIKMKMDNQQEPSVQHMQLCSMVCGSLDGRRVWGKMDTCIPMAVRPCSPEIITTLFVNQLYLNTK